MFEVVPFGETVWRVLKHGAGSCSVSRVPAGDIEAAVIDQLRAVLREPEIVAGTWKAARAHADDISEADARAALQQFDLLWDELFPAEQARIVALLVERVDIGTDGLNVGLRVDGLSMCCQTNPRSLRLAGEPTWLRQRRAAATRPRPRRGSA